MTREAIGPSMDDLHWIKSSFSDNAGGECVEVAWRKSSHSDNEGGNCVEVAPAATPAVHIRDSKDPQGPSLSVSRRGWTAFLQYATAG